jgi:hypothetical protein
MVVSGQEAKTAPFLVAAVICALPLAAAHAQRSDLPLCRDGASYPCIVTCENCDQVPAEAWVKLEREVRGARERAERSQKQGGQGRD